MTFNKNLITKCVALAMLPTMSSIAFTTNAEEVVAERNDNIERIEITSRKRTESLQNIPSSVQAINGDNLEKLGASGFEDFAGFVPGVELAQRGKEMTQIDMRGVTTGMSDRDQPEIRETVGLYFGETPIAVPGFNPNLNLYDLERVEVLRGPQPTLYGAGSLSGTVRLIPVAPNTDDFEFKGNVAAEQIKDGGVSKIFNGAVNIPLSDNSAVRIVGFVKDSAGFIDNAFTNEEDVNSGDEIGGRIAFKFEPTDTLSIDATVLHSDMEYDALSHVVDSFIDGMASDIPSDRGNNYIADSSKLEQYTPAKDEGFSDKTTIYSLVIDYEINDDIGITAVSSYMDKDFTTAYALGGVNDLFIGQDDGDDSLGIYTSDQDSTQFTQEVRLSSLDFEKNLHWVVGAFYEKRELDKPEYYHQAGIDQWLNSAYGGDADNINFPGGPFWGTQDDYLFEGDRNIKSTQIAIFAEIEYEFTDKLSATVGARWYKAESDQITNFSGAFLGTPGGIKNLKGSSDEDGVNPTVNVSYQVDDDLLVYTGASRGFRLGGTNVPAPLTLCGDNLTDKGLDGSVLDKPFESDNLWNYEVGTRSSWLDNRLTVNAAVYKIDWQGPQVPVKLACGFPVYVNGPDMDITGFEADIKASLTDDLILTMGLGLNDSTISEDHGPLAAKSGDTAPHTPKKTFSAGLDYYAEIAGKEITAHLDYRWTDDRYTRFTSNAEGYDLESYGVVNTNISVQLTEEINVQLYVKNLTDENIITYKNSQLFAEFAQVQASVLAPRTIGLKLAYKY